MALMDEARFWKIIEESREAARSLPPEQAEDFAEAHRKTLEAALKKLETKELADFDDRYHELTIRAYRWDLWGAAYWEGGGCSDDGFMDFRGCLVSLGREWYERILKNPDELAGIVGRKDVPTLQAEGFKYIAARIYRERTGKEPPDIGLQLPADPIGEDFDFDDDDLMRKHYPKLVARMPTPGEIRE